MTPRKMRASRTTPLQYRGRNADSVQAVTTSKRHFYCNLYFQLWKPKSGLKVVSSFWTEKAISKYRSVATISKFEIAVHIPVVLVGERLPQTLLPYRLYSVTPQNVQTARGKSVRLSCGQVMYLNFSLRLPPGWAWRGSPRAGWW